MLGEIFGFIGCYRHGVLLASTLLAWQLRHFFSTAKRGGRIPETGAPDATWLEFSKGVSIDMGVSSSIAR